MKVPRGTLSKGLFITCAGPDDQKQKHDFNGECDDDVHGNGSTGKAREKTDGSVALCAGLYSMGNKFNEMEACKELDSNHVNPPDFKTVTPVINRGIAPNWSIPESYCLSVPGYDFSLREAPGLGKYTWGITQDDEGNDIYEPTGLLCDVSPLSGNCDTPMDMMTESISCEVDPGDYPVCQGDEVFVRIDLNVDARGIPRLFDYPSSLRNPPDWRGPCLTHAHPTTCDEVGAIPSIPEIP